MKNISLIGMSGSGKSTIGKLLAAKLDMNFADIDNLIEKKENLTINEIFEQYSAQYFRKIEAEIIQNFNSKNYVISTGGGAFENENTRKFLLKNTTVFYMETSCGEILKRLQNTNDRPLLKDISLSKIEKMFEQRKNNYEFAPNRILTDNKSPEQIVQEILKCLN